MLLFRLPFALAVLVLAGLGCGGKKEVAAPTTKETKPSDTGTPTLPTAATVNNDAAKAAAQKVAADFAKAVQEGKATSASLTIAFKKVIAPPELEADKAAGYSESGVQAWLVSAKATAYGDDLKIDFATADYAIASASGKSHRTYLRLVRSDKTWQIDYAVFWSAANFAVPGNDTAARYFAAIAFVDALISKNFAAVEALLANSTKGKLAPPLFDTDKDQGYNRSKLQSAFADLFANKLQLTGFGGSGLPGNMFVQLYVSNDKNFSLNIRMIPGPSPGSFLIDDYQQK